MNNFERSIIDAHLSNIRKMLEGTLEKYDNDESIDYDTFSDLTQCILTEIIYAREFVKENSK